jgi:hypothetical protein
MANRTHNTLRKTADHLTDRLPVYLGIGVAALTLAVSSSKVKADSISGGVPVSAPHIPKNNKALLNRAVQQDMNQLAHDVLSFKSSSKNGRASTGSAISITRKRGVDVVTETVSADSFNGSDRGEYYFSYSADAKPNGNVHKILIAEGINEPNGQFVPYSLDYGEMHTTVGNNTGGAVASITHNFNIPKAKQSEAAVFTRQNEQPLNNPEIRSWDNQAEGIIKAAENGSATRDLPLAFKELAGYIIFAL